MKNVNPKNKAFTLIELIAVVVIIAIAALIAIPMFSSASGTQLRSAANMIAADLEYAKSMAISRQKTYKVIFDKDSESYQIWDDSAVIAHPVKIGSDYIVNFSADRTVNRVNIVSVDFGSNQEVRFNYLGSPDNGGEIIIAAGAATMTISVEPVTGFITISN